MKLKTLTTAILLSLPTAGAFAAALDRSGQSISAFLQPGNYFEAGISVLDAHVSGKVRDGYTPSAVAPAALVGLQNTSVGEMAESYYFPTAALKVQLNDKFSLGLLYDQPFGANAAYSTSTTSGHPAVGGEGAFHNGKGDATSVEVHTQNISLIAGFQPTENWNIYGGGVYQEVKGDVQLQGLAYSGNAQGLGGYRANIGKNEAYGWLAGISYQIPEIALKASVTYRSEIEHDANIKESKASGSLAPVITGFNGKGDTDITTPQSVNIDFQSGIMENTVAFANVRWVNWKDFSIRPYAFGQAAGLATSPTGSLANPGKGFDLVAYTDDQWSINVGVGRKLSEKWAANVSAGWDSGAGNPVTTLGPTEGYWNVGVGAQYSPTADTFVQAGVKYFGLGDAKAQSGADFGSDRYIANFEDNYAIGYGLKIGYKF